MKGGKDAKEFSNHVKHLITGEFLDIEEKYMVTEKNVRNHVNFMFLTNYEDSIEIDDAEDRYLVHFSEARPLPASYYKHLHKMLNSPEEMQKLYTWLYRVDLREYDPGTRAPTTPSLLRLKNEGKPNWQAQIEYMLTNNIAPFEEGHTLIQVQALTLHLQNLLGLRTLNRTPIRNYLRKKGYYSTPADSYVLMVADKAKIAGLVEVHETPDITKLLKAIEGTRPTGKEMEELVMKVYDGAWKKAHIYPLLYSQGWSNKVFSEHGEKVRRWYEITS
jgi:hypothetical protein